MPKHVAEPPKPFRAKKVGKSPVRRKAKEQPLAQVGRIANKRGPKRPVNVSISRDILSAAKRLKINLSDVLERELCRLTEDERIARWQHENREALASHRAYIERNGVFGEELLDLDDPPV